MDPNSPEIEDAAPAQQTRRGFLSTAFMFAGLFASHAAALGFAARYIYPVRKDRKQRLFVALQREFPVGSATVFKTPQGQTINVVHAQSGLTALSDICPHLGCRVHWDDVRGEFICPCHDGHFDETGQPLAGPPKDMNAPLARFDLVVVDGVIFLELPVRA